MLSNYRLSNDSPVLSAEKMFRFKCHPWKRARLFPISESMIIPLLRWHPFSDDMLDVHLQKRYLLQITSPPQSCLCRGAVGGYWPKLDIVRRRETRGRLEILPPHTSDQYIPIFHHRSDNRFARNQLQCSIP